MPSSKSLWISTAGRSMSGVKREILLLSYQGLLIETKTKKPGFLEKPGFLATGDDIIERVGFGSM
ncbi:MAG: hypothetical protein GDA43_06230 [Hormoscilla sp. SP5CHS1]|nr:hypothetical protein [Hormoscilla sp. SP5CHS1]